MKKVYGILIAMAIPAILFAQQAKYVPEKRTGIIEELIRNADSAQAVEDSITSAIRAQNPEDSEYKVIRFDIGKLKRPTSLDDFKTQFHFPPLGQYRTGTCWCFSATSFLETEAARQSGCKVKLSEMYTVYHEYLEKARHFVRSRGNYWNGEGSESEAVLLIMKEYGAVPEGIYSGHFKEPRYDHHKMSGEIEKYLNFVNSNNYWDEDKVVGTVRLILNKYMGEPPTSFEFEGKTVTPKAFLRDGMKLNLDDYVPCMSTLAVPFYTRGKFDVWDNWRRDSSYYNLPLDDWYKVIKGSIKNGYTLALGGDISEPGYMGEEDIAIVPDFDIPQNLINQDSRELRFYNETTTDDHGVHVVGFTNMGGHDWYLVKDSSRRLAQGKFEGYVFYSDDYIRLKMLTFLVHKDALEKALGKKI